MTLRQTIFQAREMLLDYHENKLDVARTELVKKALSSDVETERALNQIKKGLDFAAQLSKVQMNESFSEHLLQSENFMSILFHYSHFKNWNQAVRTSTYAIISCLIIVVLFMSLPRSLLTKFKHKPSQELVLSTLPKAQDLADDANDPEKRDAQNAVAQNLPTDTDEEESSGSEESSGDEHAEAPPTIPVQKKLVANQPVEEPQTAEETEAAEKRPRGFVYRGTMKIDNLDERTSEIAQQIADLGGSKAGEVELGWRKENKGSYYHFSLPEENYDKLLEYLHGFGPVRFSKDSHPRVMPQGQIRIILWVERKQNE